MILTRTAILLLVPALLVAALWALVPGLSGGFLFDDHVNLPALGEYGGVRDWRTLALYLTSGLGDPIGRPLSLLSFLIDATNWPASPYRFLLTNILLHLLNGMLLLLVLQRLGDALQLRPVHALLAAVLASGIWLLHPLFLSTTLYVVQRETMLATTFVLLGMLLWIGGRQRLGRGRGGFGHAFLFAASLGCTALAALCKANGLLLPLLLQVAEVSVLAGLPALARPARTWLLGLPVLILGSVMIGALPQWADQAATTRPWSLAQRMLTEPRVLLDYVGLLIGPRPITNGPFHDEYLVSIDWLHPAATLPSVFLVIAAIVAAWRTRQRWPAAAFAILFFFAAHLLESSVVPLELYFEHRNYLPAMMVFWPLAIWLSSPDGRLLAARTATATFILFALAWETHVGAQFWGRPEQLAFAWAARNSHSARAQVYAAQYEMAQGDNIAAQRRLLAGLARYPEQTQLAFNLADAQCALGELPAATVAAMKFAVAHDASAARLEFSWLQDAVARAQTSECRGLNLETLESVLDAARANQHFANAPGRLQDFEHLQGLIDLARKEPAKALAAFDRAVAALPTPQTALTQSALLGSAGYAREGLRHLDAFLAGHPLQPARFGFSAAQLHAWLLWHYGYWSDEFARVRALLAGDAHALDNAGVRTDNAILSHDG